MASPKQNVHSDFMSRFATELRARRKLLNLTQEQVADAAGVSAKFVGLVESGKPTVRLDALESVLAVLGFTLTLGQAR